jgi:hypothetical protein
MDLGIPPLRIQNLLESKIPKSRFSVRELILLQLETWRN